MKKRNWKDLFMTVFDVMFVLVLCFVILLTTMLVTQGGGEEPFTGYTINVPILCGVVVALVGYLCFLLKVSIGMLRDLIRHSFSRHSAPGAEKEEK